MGLYENPNINHIERVTHELAHFWTLAPAQGQYTHELVGKSARSGNLENLVRTLVEQHKPKAQDENEMLTCAVTCMVLEPCLEDLDMAVEVEVAAGGLRRSKQPRKTLGAWVKHTKSLQQTKAAKEGRAAVQASLMYLARMPDLWPELYRANDAKYYLWSGKGRT